ncbi:dehydrogenase [Clostridium thermosuccinogenes]|jgi:predicted dehydrogenase|uniref:Dehydrogenase n=1 Tax=Clostridium thermosuccinogenes TaxID=84032 RepID=A0A2K2F5Z8_9CLOT|nr:Gfo/Idh/MocA family oxidoreductase [Pseudoclostridium thermosuccinogenes]AUS97908.1 dehydrogenase [Pseudoclostridium thermosuccinogenes]PNT94196.1 dehydrogenase [Pseudoclostridium thermosuccinogenes]PNU00205.1 dehydrogenase [Pseudoclostridium thermosuccinogenes]PNU01529.1 dehydrogenase [Pseudoclostridium thermosuccinogenes]
MEDKLNVGLIGYKFMGKAHSNAFQRIGMFFEPSRKIVMKAICGRNESWVRESAQKYGWEGYETSWEKLVRRDDIDMVDITTPSNFHKEIAIAAAENGKHVFCEKPLALNLKDAREMLKAAEKNNIKHQIGFNYRFIPAIQLAKKLIDKGKIGKIYHFRGTYLQDFIVDPLFPLVWRLDKEVAGSGSLGDLGAHIIDVARFLVGEFDRVIGINKTFIKERPLVERMTGLSGKAQSDAPMGEVTVDDATIFLAEFKNGALGSIEATRFANGHKNAMSFEINGSKGSIKFEFERMNELQYFSSEDEEGVQGFRLIQATEGIHPYMQAWWPAGHVIGYEHTFVHELYEFTEAIAKDRHPEPDFNDGVKCSQVLEAVDLSIEERQWVEVDSL